MTDSLFPLVPLRLGLVPITLTEAREYVSQHHRHHKTTVGGRFAIGAGYGSEIVGVAIVGRPVARALNDGWTAEVTRLCTDGTRNACSFLYAAAWRSWRAMGGRRLVTYTLPSEGGVSLRAAGWVVVGEVKGREWDTPSRPRVEAAGVQTLDKLRWEPLDSRPAVERIAGYVA
jgi:hypothetical protein